MNNKILNGLVALSLLSPAVCFAQAVPCASDDAARTADTAWFQAHPEFTISMAQVLTNSSAGVNSTRGKFYSCDGGTANETRTLTLAGEASEVYGDALDAFNKANAPRTSACKIYEVMKNMLSGVTITPDTAAALEKAKANCDAAPVPLPVLEAHVKAAELLLFQLGKASCRDNAVAVTVTDGVDVAHIPSPRCDPDTQLLAPDHW